MSIKKDTVSGIAWSFFERISVQGVHFLIGILLARLLMPSDFGTVAMVSVFYTVSKAIINSGFHNALIRKEKRSNEDYCTVFIFNVCMSSLFYVILFFAAPWVADFFDTPILCSILRVQSICLIIDSLGTIQVTRLTIHLNFKGLAKRATIASVISGLIGVSMAFLGFGLWALVAESITSSLLNMLLVWFYSNWRPSLIFSVKSFKDMFAFGWKLLVTGLINTIYSNLTPLIIGKFYTKADLGEYMRGTRFARFPCEMFTLSLKRVTYPLLAKLQSDTEKMISVYRKYVCSMSMCVFFGCTLLAAVARPFILFLLTEKWEASIIYLQIYVFSCMFDHISAINLNLLKVVGRSDIFLKLEIIKKVISLAILLAAIPFGVVGICVSKVIFTQIGLVINTYYTGKLFNLGYIEQFKDYSGFFMYSVIACLPAYLFTFLHLNHLISLIFGLLSAPLLYWLMLRNNPYMKDVLEMVKEKLPRR